MDSPHPSRANVSISNLSVPLAWNSDQHFKSKGESRTYSMFIVLQTKTKVVDTRIATNIDRTMTDVVFPESFIFEREPEDFYIELTIYAARTDTGLSEGGGSLRHKITRSLGRKFGTNIKSQLSNIDPNKIGPNPSSVLGSTHFNMVARSYFVLTDASSDTRVQDMKMSAFADLCGPPLYGHIICRLMVQPTSVLYPLAEGHLNVQRVGEMETFKGVRTRLQAGILQCFTQKDGTYGEEQSILYFPLSAKSRIMPAADECSSIVSNEGSELFITADTKRLMTAWTAALQVQINDCATWGKFAFSSTSLLGERKQDPVKETMSKSTGGRLYDNINISGTIARGGSFLGLPTQGYTPREMSPLRSIPNRKPKQRQTVLDLFRQNFLGSDERNQSNGYEPIYETHGRTRNDSCGLPSIMENDYAPVVRQNHSYLEPQTWRPPTKKVWSRSFSGGISKPMFDSEVTRL